MSRSLSWRPIAGTLLLLSLCCARPAAAAEVELDLAVGYGVGTLLPGSLTEVAPQGDSGDEGAGTFQSLRLQTGLRIPTLWFGLTGELGEYSPSGSGDGSYYVVDALLRWSPYIVLQHIRPYAQAGAGVLIGKRKERGSGAVVEWIGGAASTLLIGVGADLQLGPWRLRLDVPYHLYLDGGYLSVGLLGGVAF